MRKNFTSKHVFRLSVAAVLAASLATTCLMAGCGDEKDSTAETKVVKETQIITHIEEETVIGTDKNGKDTAKTTDAQSKDNAGSKQTDQLTTIVVNGVYEDLEGNVITNEDNEPMTAPPGTPDTKKDSKGNYIIDSSDKSGSNQKATEPKESDSDSGSSSDKKQSGSSDTKQDSDSGSSNTGKSSDSGSSDKSGGGNSGNSGNNGGNSGNNGGNSGESSDSSGNNGGDNSGDNSGDSGNKDTDNKDTDKSATLSIDGNSFAVGSTVVCEYQLSAPEDLLNFQGIITYDTSVLKVKSAKLLKPASTGGVLNYKLDGRIRFNGINLNGYEYGNNQQPLLSVEYEVVGEGSTNPVFKWEIVTGYSDKILVNKDHSDSSIKVTASYTEK